MWLIAHEPQIEEVEDKDTIRCIELAGAAWGA